MSRTYRKIIRCGNCCGSNTNYYRTRRRIFRRKTKQQLRINLEDFVHPEKLKKFKDSWDEPTDGSWRVNWDVIKHDLYDAQAGRPYWDIDDVYFDMKYFGRYLKPNKFSRKNLRKYKKANR